MVNPIRGAIGVALAASALVGLPAAALADVKAGVDAWATGDFATAVREWEGPAKAGDPDAQFNLAQAYKLGRGVPRDLARAETLYASAAAKGHLQASDNYGLLLFQRGERAQAMPYVKSAASRDDARAQYILGLAMFNGDTVAKDWVRAYALVSLAQQAGLPQAAGALTQMDQHVSMAERQQAVPLAAQIASEAESTRARQVAAADLGDFAGDGAVADTEQGAPPPSRPKPRIASRAPTVAAVEQAATDAARASRPSRPASVPTPRATKPAPAKAPVASGRWRLQLGAFGVPGNAEALWARLKGRPELAGHGKLLVPAGKLTRLQATGFASQADASAACARLKAGGFACIPSPN